MGCYKGEVIGECLLFVLLLYKEINVMFWIVMVFVVLGGVFVMVLVVVLV